MPVLKGEQDACKATFKIVSWDEEPFDDPEGGPKLTQAHVKKSFEGDLIHVNYFCRLCANYFCRSDSLST